MTTVLALVVTVAAALVAAALLDSVMPHPRRRWQTAVERLARATKHRLRPGSARRPDPFDVLRLQTQLGVVSRQIHTLKNDPDAYAKAHRLVAAKAAYDDLLDEACKLASIPVSADRPRDEGTRWQEEQQLAERGWSW